MANASLAIDNHAELGSVTASRQALTMPASNLLTPHPSERWRSPVNSAFFVLNKGAAKLADTVMLCGLTGGPNTTVRLRVSTSDATGALGDVLDTNDLSSGDRHFDLYYGSFVYKLPSPRSYQFVRFDITDPDASIVEAGTIFDSLSETFVHNFAPGETIQHVDRSRVSPTASGMTLVWDDNVFRRLSLSFPWVISDQRFDLIERLDREKGQKRNVLLIIDPDSDNLPRDTILGLVKNQSPVASGQRFAVDGKPLFGKQLSIDERI